MKPTTLLPSAFAALLLATAAPFATAAHAAEPALTVRQGDIFTDPVGTVMNVSVVNAGATTVGAAVVTCDFTTKGKPAGTASTTIYNIEAGATGKDQVHLMGGTADGASCVISSTAPAAN